MLFVFFCSFVVLLHKTSFVSAVFDFNASLNDAAPAFSMPLPFD